MNPVSVLPFRTGLDGIVPLSSASLADGPSPVFFLLRFFREVGVAHRSARYLMRDMAYDQLEYDAVGALGDTCRLEQAAVFGIWVRYGSKKLYGGEKSGQLVVERRRSRAAYCQESTQSFSASSKLRHRGATLSNMSGTAIVLRQ